MSKGINILVTMVLMFVGMLCLGWGGVFAVQQSFQPVNVWGILLGFGVFILGAIMIRVGSDL